MKKIMISILATITITTAIATILINQKNVLAQEENERLKFNENQEVNKKEIWELSIDSEGTEYLKSNNNEEIREAWRYDDEGNLISVPMSEYLSILNSTVNTGDLGIASNEYIESREEKHVKENKSPNEIWKYRYTQTSKSYPYGSAIKVMPSVNGGANGATISYGNQTIVSASYGGQASVNASVKKALTVGVNFTWNHSATSNSNFGMTYKIPPNKTGYIIFQPKLTHSKGSAYKDVYNGANVKIRTENLGMAEGYSPNKLANGFADGVFSLKLQ